MVLYKNRNAMVRLPDRETDFDSSGVLLGETLVPYLVIFCREYDTSGGVMLNKLD